MAGKNYFSARRTYFDSTLLSQFVSQIFWSSVTLRCSLCLIFSRWAYSVGMHGETLLFISIRLGSSSRSGCKGWRHLGCATAIILLPHTWPLFGRVPLQAVLDGRGSYNSTSTKDRPQSKTSPRSWTCISPPDSSWPSPRPASYTFPSQRVAVLKPAPGASTEVCSARKISRVVRQVWSVLREGSLYWESRQTPGQTDLIIPTRNPLNRLILLWPDAASSPTSTSYHPPTFSPQPPFATYYLICVLHNPFWPGPLAPSLACLPSLYHLSLSSSALFTPCR